jgi:hypothetical protein
MKKNATKPQVNHLLYNRDNGDSITVSQSNLKSNGGFELDICNKDGGIKCRIIGFVKQNRMFGQINESTNKALGKRDLSKYQRHA